jgi:hypothetical protein
MCVDRKSLCHAQTVGHTEAARPTRRWTGPWPSTTYATPNWTLSETAGERSLQRVVVGNAGVLQNADIAVTHVAAEEIVGQSTTRGGIQVRALETRPIWNRVLIPRLHEMTRHIADIRNVQQGAEADLALDSQAIVIDRRGFVDPLNSLDIAGRKHSAGRLE